MLNIEKRIQLSQKFFQNHWLEVQYYVRFVSIMKFFLPIKTQEVLTKLATGGILAFRRTPQNYFRLTRQGRGPWGTLNRKTLLYAIRRLYKQGLADIHEGLDGITTVTLTDAGRVYSEVNAKQRGYTERPETWDRKWRLVLFDIPEVKKKSREAFRYHLRRMGFTEFKRSAFLFPFPCAEMVDALAEQLSITAHVVMVTAESISNEFQYKKQFGLL